MNQEEMLVGKRVFIAGPMRGYEKYNFPKFDKIEKALKDHGIECINPGRISRKFKEKDVNSDINVYNEMVRLQQEAEKTCNAILLLDGWQWSKGVQLEVKTAAELGMQFLLESDIPEEWLDNGFNGFSLLNCRASETEMETGTADTPLSSSEAARCL